MPRGKKTPTKTPASSPVVGGRRRQAPETKELDADRAVELGIMDAPDSLRAMQEAVEQQEAAGGRPADFGAGDPEDMSVRPSSFDAREDPRNELGLPEQQGSTVEQAAAKIEAALAAEEGEDVPAEGEQGELEGSAEDTSADEADESDAEDSEEGEAAVPAKLTHKALLKQHGDMLVEQKDGSEVRLRDLVSDGLRQQDYTKKSQEVATERAGLIAERESLASDARTVETLLNGLAKVASERLSAEERSALAQMAAVAAQGAGTLEGRNAEDRSAESAAYVEAQEAQFVKDMGLENASADEVMDFKRELAEGATQEFGFSIEELASVQDSRVLNVLHEALQYRKGAQRVADARKNGGRSRSPTLQPGTASDRFVSGQGRARRRSLNDAKARLKKTGSVSDAQKAFAAILEAQGD